ncbi:hypothetical protein NDU88_003564 [Pleurodeles waltl]|uniref:Uncharacterized protein n=1 Tax=Pleurodeles waltl TaxID=8319 RepID=A0AAV7T5Q3_PLEWA|nr:hypothetical protein NDU88_003564 [Pleurodeles waltl]
MDGRLASQCCVTTTPPVRPKRPSVLSAPPLRLYAEPQGPVSSARLRPGQQLRPIGAPRGDHHSLAQPLHRGGSGPLFPRVQGRQSVSPGAGTPSLELRPSLRRTSQAGSAAIGQTPSLESPAFVPCSGPRQGCPAMLARIPAGAQRSVATVHHPLRRVPHAAPSLVAPGLGLVRQMIGRPLRSRLIIRPPSWPAWPLPLVLFNTLHKTVK